MWILNIWGLLVLVKMWQWFYISKNDFKNLKKLERILIFVFFIKIQSKNYSFWTAPAFSPIPLFLGKYFILILIAKFEEVNPPIELGVNSFTVKKICGNTFRWRKNKQIITTYPNFIYDVSNVLHPSSG